MRPLTLKKLTIAAAFGAALAAASPVSAQISTTANGPYYATPSWDQKLTTNRFVILANWSTTAVLDRETGLVWERSPDLTKRDWYAAFNHCLFRKVGGRAGWRMPRLPELLSLLESPDGTSLALPPGHPFTNLGSDFYWSATSSVVPGSTSAFASRVDTAFSLALAKSGNSVYVWCVRGGQGPDVE